MPVLFWIILAAMALAAACFVAGPMLQARAPNPVPTAVSLLLVLVVAVLIYTALGSPAEGVARSNNGAGTAIAPGNPNPVVGSVASLIDGLAARLQKEPENAEGWLLLARSYLHLGRNDEATRAYMRAVSLGKSDAEFESRLPGIESGGSTAEIHGKIRLAPDAKGKLLPGDAVFIFAKRVDGPPMPLAVIRKSAADLPFEFVLSDDHAMLKGEGLSSHDEVIVDANISRTGNAMDTLAGLQVTGVAASTSSRKVIELLIESRDSATSTRSGQ